MLSFGELCSVWAGLVAHPLGFGEGGMAKALPPLVCAADTVNASAALVAAVADGDLTPAEAAELGKLIEACVRALEATDFASRLDNLERNR
jgi:hypothetical protein